MHEEQTTNLPEDRQEQIYHHVKVKVFGFDTAAQAAFRLAMGEKRRQYDQDWEVRKVPALRKRLEFECFHFGKPKMHLLSHYHEFIVRMGASDNFSTDISELLHISNVTDACRASNRVNFICQVLAHNNRHTALDYMHQTLRWLALQGWHDKDSAATLNLRCAADKRRYTRCAR